MNKFDELLGIYEIDQKDEIEYNNKLLDNNEPLDNKPKSEYINRNIHKYHDYVSKLKTVLSDNKYINKFRFIGQKELNTNKYGITVLGFDINGIDFSKFYSLSDINYYFGNFVNRLEK